MVQKKHKKRRHNAKQPEAVAQTQASETQEQPKEMTRAEKREAAKAAKAQAKAEEEKRAKKEAKGKDGKAARPGRWQRIKDWFKAVRVEMHRVVWPTRSELLNASLIVIGALVFFGVFIAIIDNVILIPLNWIASIGA